MMTQRASKIGLKDSVRILVCRKRRMMYTGKKKISSERIDLAYYTHPINSGAVIKCSLSL